MGFDPKKYGAKEVTQSSGGFDPVKYGGRPLDEAPAPKPIEVKPYGMATLGGNLQPAGTFDNSPKPFDMTAYLRGEKQDTPTKPATNKAGISVGAKIGKTSKTNPAEFIWKDKNAAINKALEKKNKGFIVTPEGAGVQRQTLEKEIEEGNLIVEKDDKGESYLKRGTGVWESLKNAVSDSYLRDLESKYVQQLSDEDAIRHLNIKAEHPNLEGYSEGTPNSKAAEVAQTIGGTLGIMAKGAVAATALTQAAPAAIGTGSFGSFLGMASDLSNQGWMDAAEKNYFKLKEQGLSDQEAWSKAKNLGLVGAATELAVGAVQGQAPFQAVKNTVKKEAVKGVLDGVSKSFLHLMKDEMPKVVASEIAGRGAQAGIEQAAGVKVKSEDVAKNIKDNIVGELMLPFGLWALTQPAAIPSYLRPRVENLVASADRGAVAEVYQNMEAAGQVEAGTTEKVIGKLEQFDKAKSPYEALPIDEEKKAALAGKDLQISKAESADQAQELNKEKAELFKADDTLDVEKDNITGKTLKEDAETKSIEPVTEGLVETKGGNEPKPTVESGNGEVDVIEEGKGAEGKFVAKNIIEPSKPIAEMNSEELYEHGQAVRKALNKQDKEFEGKSEAEKEAAGYYDYIDNASDLKDLSTRVNYVENAENINDLTSSAKSALTNIKDVPSEYDMAVLNAVKKRAEQLKIEPEELMKAIVKSVGNDYKDADDAQFMMRDVVEKIFNSQSNEQDTGTTAEISGIEEPNTIAAEEPIIEGDAQADVEGTQPIDADAPAPVLNEPPPIDPPPPPVDNAAVKPPDLSDKGILNRLHDSKNISPDVKTKFSDKLKYEPKSNEESRSIAKDVMKEYSLDEAVSLAEGRRFSGGVNSAIFAEALDTLYDVERKATKEEKKATAQKFADIAIRYDEWARSMGRDIAQISHFYRRSPLGIQIAEKINRDAQFSEWLRNKEKPLKEVFEEIIKEPEIQELFKEKVENQLKQERAASRLKRRKKIEDFFDGAKFKGDAMYSTVIPPQLINAAIEGMKQTVLAGESAVNVVQKAIEEISKGLGKDDWDKEKFRAEWEEKVRKATGEQESAAKEVSPDKQQKILDKFRKKLKGLSESEKDQVIRQSFKKLVENGALEYADFKSIIADVLGYGELTEAESKRITELVNDINVVEEIGIKAREARTIEALDEYKKANKKAELSATELSKILYNKPRIFSRILGLMQLNTLGAAALTVNVAYNVAYQSLVRFPVSVQLSLLDQLIYRTSKALGNPIQPENNTLAAQGAYFKNVGRGLGQAIQQFGTGLTSRDITQKEVYSAGSMHPLDSLKEIWDFKQGKTKLTTGQVVDKAIQASPVGWVGEAIARTLNVGDKPQRFGAEGAQAATFANNLGLSNIDKAFFYEFPKEEAYRAYKAKGLSDEAAMAKAEEVRDRIVKQGEEAVFQQDNMVSNAITGFMKPFGKPGEFFRVINMPYMKIPLNAFWTSFNLINPEVALLQSAIFAAKAAKAISNGETGAHHIQSSKKWLAHASVGWALMSVAGALVSKGIVNSPNENDDTKKERIGEQTYQEQKTIDLTKFGAVLSGKDPNKVERSFLVDLKWLGVGGEILSHQAKRIEEMTAEQKKAQRGLVEDMLPNLQASALNFLDNGIFSNSTNIMTSIRRGDFTGYGLGLLNMATNVVQPAIFAQHSKAQLGYYSPQKADTFYEAVKNNYLQRSSALRKITGQMPPSKVNIWGDTLKKTDGVAMRLFGMSSSNKDNFAQPIYEDVKRTGNIKFFPPAVMPEVNNIKLNTKEQVEFEQLVGKVRKSMTAPFINDGAELEGFDKRYSRLSDDEKIRALNIIYDEGYKSAKDQFTEKYPKFIKPEKTEDKQEEDYSAKSLEGQ